MKNKNSFSTVIGIGMAGLVILLAFGALMGQALQVEGKPLVLEELAPLAQASVPGTPGGEEGESVSLAALREVVPGGPGFLMISPLQFKPWHPNVMWDFYYLDLYNPGLEYGSYSAALTLPNNINITQVVVYYYDNCAGDLMMRLWLGDQSGGYGLMAETYSSGAINGYRTVSDQVINYPKIDQQNYSYILEVQIPNGFSTNLRLAGVRVDYAYLTSLPLVVNGE